MEIGQIVLGIILFLFCIGSIFILRYNSRANKREIYVYKKDGDKFRLFCSGSMKDAHTGYWLKAVIYIGLKTGNIYIREEQDFYREFIPLEEYKNGGENNGNRD